LAAITELDDAINSRAHRRILGDMIHSAGFEVGGNRPEECVVSVDGDGLVLRQGARSLCVFALDRTREGDARTGRCPALDVTSPVSSALFVQRMGK